MGSWGVLSLTPLDHRVEPRSPGPQQFPLEHTVPKPHKDTLGSGHPSKVLVLGSCGSVLARPQAAGAQLVRLQVPHLEKLPGAQPSSSSVHRTLHADDRLVGETQPGSMAGDLDRPVSCWKEVRLAKQVELGLNISTYGWVSYSASPSLSFLKTGKVDEGHVVVGGLRTCSMKCQPWCLAQSRGALFSFFFSPYLAPFSFPLFHFFLLLVGVLKISQIWIRHDVNLVISKIFGFNMDLFKVFTELQNWFCFILWLFYSCKNLKLLDRKLNLHLLQWKVKSFKSQLEDFLSRYVYIQVTDAQRQHLWSSR